jgi:hypothetical protein
MNYNNYVGPYLKCCFHYNEVKIEKFGCSKCNNKKSDFSGKKYKFCPECGNEYGNYEIEEKEKSVNHWDLLEDTFMDTFETEFGDFDILMPNGDDFEGRDFDISDDGCLQEIDSERILKETKWFENKYEKEIKLLIDNYDKVEIKWGVIRYYS